MISNLRILSVRTPSKRGTVLLPTRGTMFLVSRACLATALLVMMAALDQSVHAEDGGQTRISAHFDAVHRSLGYSRCNLRERCAVVGSLGSGSGPSGS